MNKHYIIAQLLQVVKYSFMLITSTVIIALFYIIPAPAERIPDIQTNLITVSGIIAGIVIAYLATKLFSIKQTRENRQIHINRLSNKLTNYRKVISYVIKSNSFWVRKKDIAIFKEKYGSLSLADLHYEVEYISEDNKQLLNNYFQDDTLSSTTIDLYLSMETISPEAEDLFPSLLFDPNIAYNYSSEYLNLILTPTNQIWYYLKGRYAKHTEGLINDSQPFSIHANSVMECMTRINKKLKGKDFSRITLADVSSKFHSEYLPKMIELTRLNEEPLPSSIKSLMKTLILIFAFGVCIPLIIQCLFLTTKWNVTLTLCCVLITINFFINFIFNLYNIINEEIYPEIN